VVTGLLGGSGGPATAIAELPVTTALILRSIQEISASYGEDPQDPLTKNQCILVFALGGPLDEDDQADAGFIAARIAIGEQTIAALIRTVASRFGLVVSEKLLVESAPILGAAGGAFVNYTFTDYYQRMAHVHFRLRTIERAHAPDRVAACFKRIISLRREQRQADRTKK